MLFSYDNVFKITSSDSRISSLLEKNILPPQINDTKYIDIKLKTNNDNNDNNNNNNEVNFRLSLVSSDGGGTGGNRVWDAALFLSQWILFNEDKFRNKKVIELGNYYHYYRDYDHNCNHHYNFRRRIRIARFFCISNIIISNTNRHDNRSY